MVALYKGATPIIRRYKGTQLIFDATPSDEPIINDTLSFAWSGTSSTMQYKLNGKTYTASSNPFTTTLTDLGIDNFTNANTMFNSKRAITAVTSIPDTSNVTDMYYMFRYLGVSELDVTKTMNTSACTNMNFMFAYCPNLTSLDLSSFDVSNVKNMGMMFYGCTKLDYLDISGWDLRNVTSKSGMFGNGVKPSKVIMNGCDCDTILFIRQELHNNGLIHSNIVQTDTVCSTYETYSKVTYNIYKPSDNCAYNEYIYPSSVIENTNKKDEYGVTSNTSSYITNYVVKFQLQENGELVEGDNETSSERVIVGVVYYDGKHIGEYQFKQKAKPTDSGGSNSLSCYFDKSTQITDLYFDMDNLPEEMGYWWVGFSYNSNQVGDCTNCNWSNGNLRICLYENRYEGIMDGRITNLEQVNGLYHLHLDEPLYFMCGEENAHLERYYLTPDKSAYCDDTISFRWDGNKTDSFEFELQLMTRNVYREDCEDNGDGTYTYTTTLSDMGIETLTNCNWAFSHSRYLVELIKFPCTDTVTDMRDMFTSSYVSNLDLSSWDVSNVIVMAGMFNNCNDLETLNLNGWKLNDNVDIENMFSYCNNLREIYLKNSDESTYMRIQDVLNQSGINAMIITE